MAEAADSNLRKPRPAEPEAAASSAAGEGGSTVLVPEGGASVGSSRRGGSSQRTAIPLSEAVLVEEEKTVISKRPPLAEGMPPHPGSPAEIGKLLLGSTLGHFHLDSYVGGGMGAVFRATDTMLGRTVAVKVLSRDQSDDETIRRFKNEAQSTARLDHANIARVFHVGEESGWNYIVFEFIEGENLRDVVTRTGPLSLDDAVSYTLQVAEALEHASRRDVVHRDIKPSNVIVTADGRIKLVDMGLARLHQVESSNHDLTASGVTLGTFDYISPEQARDPRTADVRSDLYSLGCTLFFILTGRPPFPEGTVLQKLLSHSTDEVPDPRQVRPDLPEEVSAILRKLTAKQPSDRYQEPSELIGELLLLATRQHLRCGSRGGTVWITPTEQRLSFWERHLPWMAPVGILLLVVIGLDYFWPAKRGGEGEAVVKEGDSPAAPMAPLVSLDPAQAVASDNTNSKPPSEKVAGGENAGTTTKNGTVKLESPTETKGAPTTPAAPGEIRPTEVANKPTRSELGTPRLQGELALAANSGELGPKGVPGALLTEAARSTQVNSSEASPRAAAQDVKTIVVDPVGEATSDGKTEVATSLADAVRRLTEFPSVSLIELRVRGPHITPPFTLGNRAVTIRAAEGYAPEVVFRPQVGDLTQHPRAMIRLPGGETSWEGLHLRVELPLEPATGEWSLFEVGDVKSLRMMNCTLTIANAGVNRSAYHPLVSFFDLQDGGSAARMRMGERPDSTVAIDLWHTSARGEATLVSADEVRPLKFYWGNGLLVTSGRMFEFGGAHTPPAAEAHIRIDLSHVTAVCGGGLFLATSSDAAPHQLTANLRSHDCIFALGDAPVVEQQGNSGEQMKESLIVSGSGNFYWNASVLWRLVEREPSPRVEEIDFADWARQWPNEKLPQRRVEWRSEWTSLGERPPSQHVRADYLLSDSPSNLAATSAENHLPAGFNVDLLPEFSQPAAASSSPVSPAPEEEPE